MLNYYGQRASKIQTRQESLSIPRRQLEKLRKAAAESLSAHRLLLRASVTPKATGQRTIHRLRGPTLEGNTMQSIQQACSWKPVSKNQVADL